MPRLLDNWLYSFRDWTVPRSEAPEFTLSSVAKRKVLWPKSMMGSYEILPHLYVIFVGPPGVVRKSTTSAYAEELLGEIDHINVASTASSTSKLIETMSETIDGSLCIISSEFGSFVSVSQEEMYDLLTDIYDGKAKYEYATRMHGIELVASPCINLLGATTPAWVAEQMPAYVIGGGFASRTIFVFEDSVRQRTLYYNLDWPDFERVKGKLVHDLRHIAGLVGEFRHDSEETRAWAEDWYRSSADEDIHEKLEGYRNRRHVHLHKVAGLLSMAERDDLVVTRTHFESALAILSGIEVKLPRIFSAVGKNPYSSDIEVIRAFIMEKGQVDFERLMARFYHNLSRDALLETLSALQAMGDVIRVPNPNGREGVTAYRWKTHVEGTEATESP
jgi:DNA polymerase III delta prime subunit